MNKEEFTIEGLIWLKKMYKQEMSVKFGKTKRLTKRRILRRRLLANKIEREEHLLQELEANRI